MESTKKQMLKLMKGYGEGVVKSVCEAYALNYEEVLKKVMGEEEEVKRGRPAKKAKRVVNKELVVEDVIVKGLMAEVAEEEKAEVVAEEEKAEVVAEEEKAEEKPVKEKKKAAPKKQAEAEGSGEEEKPVKEKKKRAPKKKEAEAEGSGDEEKPVKEKKKRAPKKKQAEAEGSGEEVKPAEEPKTIGGFAMKTAEEMKPKIKDIAVKASPAKEVEEEELEEEETITEEIEYNEYTYLVTDDSVVYDAETREAVGTWDGTAVKFYTGDEE